MEKQIGRDRKRWKDTEAPWQRETEKRDIKIEVLRSYKETQRDINKR